MLNRFKNRFKNLKQKLLVSVSGGLDSMVLCDLLLKSDLDFSIAHVNYKLRKKESDFDENFVKNYANQKQINFYSISHDLSTYNKSIQAKAREIRYEFLYKLTDENKFDYILTGHHLDDNIETIFLNLIRGKKNNSFLGIREKHNQLLRPLINFTKDEIIESAKKSNAHHFIQELPDKYETKITERGLNFSGGQIQRIAIARAILGNPAILLLDEATSALDAESEAEVQEGLNRAMKNRTVIVIAHRLATTQEADKIVVFDKGEIIEIGKHTDLISKNGIYKELCEKQLINKL